MIVLDTHALLWADSDNRKLGSRTRAFIEKAWAAGRVSTAAISFWEVGLLKARRRIELPGSVRDWRSRLLQAGLIELPLDGAIAVRALDLVGLHDDPADRFILATALVHDACLVTADERLLAWKHALERQDARA